MMSIRVRVLFFVQCLVLVSMTMLVGGLFATYIDLLMCSFMGTMPADVGEYARRGFIGAVLVIAYLWLWSAYRFGLDVQARKRA